MAEDDDSHTFSTKFRLPRRMWETYGRVVGDRERGSDLLEHVRAVITDRGTDADRAELAAAEQELAERRSRKGGRPPKAKDTAIKPGGEE